MFIVMLFLILLNRQVEAFRMLMVAQEEGTYTEELELSCLQVFPGDVAELLLVVEQFGEDFVDKTDEELNGILDQFTTLLTYEHH